jgi:hypothetical protein
MVQAVGCGASGLAGSGMWWDRQWCMPIDAFMMFGMFELIPMTIT